MRFTLCLLASTALAACSGGGPTTVGGSAVTSSGVGTVVSSGHTFVAPTEAKTYAGIGGTQSFEYSTDDRARVGGGLQYDQLFAPDASTARKSGISVTYDPRDAIFNIAIKTVPGNVDASYRFQDPVHRTAFGGREEPQGGVPNLENSGFLYLEAGGLAANTVFDPAQSTVFPVGEDKASVDLATFFYQKPGTTTKYVTLAGFVRNSSTVTLVKLVNSPANDPGYLRQDYKLSRAAFAYGERTGNSAVPTTGSGTYNGAMIATLVYNPQFDDFADASTFFQWMNGTAKTTVNFAAKTFTLDLAGTVGAPLFDVFTTRRVSLDTGATFAASGAGRIDLINAGGFLGAINSASFVQNNGTRLNLTVGGSSIDGAFFGPTAQEVGGGFQIVGGVPDQRVDILGAFIGQR
jgi:C-lobe and N-lobe beta barrels of Tf-binding protein B